LEYINVCFYYTFVFIKNAKMKNTTLSKYSIKTADVIFSGASHLAAERGFLRSALIRALRKEFVQTDYTVG